MNETVMLMLCNSLTGLPLILIGILLYHGKGGFLLAGWNTMSKEKKQAWDEKSLLRFNGKCIIALGAVMMVMGVLPFIGMDAKRINAVGWAIFTVIIIGMIIYQNTGKRFRR